MIQQINTIEDIRTFIDQIANEIDNFNTFEDFASYVNSETHTRIYTDDEASIRNANLNRCIAVCELQAGSTIEYIEWFYDLKRLCIEHEQV